MLFSPAMIVLLLLVPSFYYSQTLDLPPSFPKCNRNDPNLNDCIKSAYGVVLPILAQGLPEFKLESIDPIKIEKMSIGEGTGAVHVVQHYNQIEYHNLFKTTVESVDAKVTDNDLKIILNVFAEDVHMSANYDLNGYILILPIVGEGESTIALKNAKIKLVITGETYDNQGTKYMEVKNFTVKLDPELITLDFQNLFNGDPILGPEMNHVLNENWRDLFIDVGHGYEEALGQAFKRIANIIFSQVPYDGLFSV